MLRKNFLRDNTKPKNSPNPKRWLEEINGTIELDKNKVPPVWIYTDANGNKIAYPDGFPDFENGIPPQVKNVHLLEDGFEDYYDDFSKAGDLGLGNTWHHQDGKTLQAVDSEIHKLFTYRGGLLIKRNGGK